MLEWFADPLFSAATVTRTQRYTYAREINQNHHIDHVKTIQPSQSSQPMDGIMRRECAELSIARVELADPVEEMSTYHMPHSELSSG
jgi:hypothetical protein